MALIEKVNQQLAEETIEAWLDAKKVKPKERQDKASLIEVLVDAVRYGNIAIDDNTRVITQFLDFPLTDSGGSVILSELKYNPRGGTGDLLSKTANLKGIGMAVYIAFASTLTGQMVATLNKLDGEDFKVLQAITSFFL
jgi:hypothetical protein